MHDAPVPDPTGVESAGRLIRAARPTHYASLFKRRFSACSSLLQLRLDALFEKCNLSAAATIRSVTGWLHGASLGNFARLALNRTRHCRDTKAWPPAFAPSYDPTLAVMRAGNCAGRISTRCAHDINAPGPSSQFRTSVIAYHMPA